MKIGGLIVSLLLSSAVFADTSKNPDRYPSLGIDLIKAQAAGIARAGVNGMQTDGQQIGFNADFRYPVTNVVTLHASAETLGINNNKEFTDSYRLGMGVRVYFRPE